MFKYFGPQLVFLLFLFFLLELTVMPFASVFGVKPDLLFVLVVFYSIFIYPNRTPHFAVLVGLLSELFSGTLFGFETVSYGVSGFMLWFLVSKIDRDHISNQGLLLFLFSFFNLLLLSLLNLSLRETSFTFQDALLRNLGTSLYTTVIGLVLFYLVRIFFGLTEKDLFNRTILEE